VVPSGSKSDLWFFIQEIASVDEEAPQSGEMMNIGENLSKAREDKGLTQAQVAVIAGIPLSTYKKYEAGAQPPPGDRIGALARALGISADELVMEESERHVSEELRALFHRFDLLPDDMKSMARIVLRGVLQSFEQETLK
jgi:transcriptional regulator with XRE-family HTH domain